MTERQFYKKVYKQIFKEGKTHQEVYDEEVKESLLGPESVARSVSMVPSKAKYESLKGLLTLFIIMAMMFATVRLIIFLMYNQMADASLTGLIFAGFVVLLIPPITVYSVKNAKLFLFGLVSLIAVAAIIRSYFSNDFGSETLQYLMVAFGIGIFILSSIIPRKMRVSYTQKIVDKEQDGKIVKRITYTFDESKSMTRKEIRKENF